MYFIFFDTGNSVKIGFPKGAGSLWQGGALPSNTFTPILLLCFFLNPHLCGVKSLVKTAVEPCISYTSLQRIEFGVS